MQAITMPNNGMKIAYTLNGMKIACMQDVCHLIVVSNTKTKFWVNCYTY